MGQPAAKQGDQITATDIHIVLVPSETGPRPMPMPHPFNGTLSSGLSANVRVNGRPAATAGSSASNTPPHFPAAPGTAFQSPPTNQGRILMGSTRVRINGKPAARNGDTAQTCADPVPNATARVIAVSNVMIGG
ncbi:MAG: hypothetical protein GY943_20395 [Chloroflexi bacterium]|nr:hypothetical protein [Chloroflexota bacterium]